LGEAISPNAWFPCLLLLWSSWFVFVDRWFVASFVGAVMRDYCWVYACTAIHIF
jgi:hypothetical protein